MLRKIIQFLTGGASYQANTQRPI